MAAENKPATNINKGKKRKFIPHGKPVRKGLYPLRAGVQGFFITCDGGRERQATNEALNLLESFYEELVHESSGAKYRTIPSNPVSKIIKFKDSDSSSDEDEFPTKDKKAQELEKDSHKSVENKIEKGKDDSSQREDNCAEKHVEETDCTLAKRQCLEKGQPARETVDLSDTTKNKPIDELIEDELRDLGDRNKRHFVSLDSGCNGCIFVQMHKRLGDPSPFTIAHHMISSASSTKKHMSRYILRVLPVEVTSYASDEEISKSIKPLIEQYFPVDISPLKFAVIYESRSNTGIERMPIINAVAKSVPQPHKVDLKNPDKTIIVQIAKTVCMIGVVEGYKELAKYNLRQLTSPPQ